MKKLMLRLLAVAAFVASVSVSCSEISFIEINPPADLQSKIDSIQALKDAQNTGDKTTIDIAVAEVGAKDYTSAWWVDFSQYFTVPQGKCLTVKFINHNGTLAGTGTGNNWSNWNMCVASGERDSDGYTEFFVLRSDAYGWGNGDYNGAMISQDYPDTDGDGDIWNDFKRHLDGASVEMQIDYATAGTVFLTATHTSVDGVVLTETYEQPVTGPSVTAFLIADGSFMEVKEAWLEPSKILEIPDEMAASITVSGTPAAIEVGSTDFWGNGVATVTFADGSTTVADTADVTFVVPDLSTVGTKTIIYSYSKTKQGNYGKPVAGTYTLEVTNPIVALEASANAYLIGGAKYVTVSPAAVKVIAEYADGSKAPLKASQFSVAFADDKVVYEGVEGTYADAYTVTYTTASGTAIEAKGALTIAKSDLPAQTEMVGLEDNTTPWWAHFSHDWAVAPYEMVSVSMKLGSNEINNWHSPCTIMRRADLSEYGVVRMDHFGWGAGYDGIVTATSNWNWDTFLPNLDGAEVAITVANNGDNTASIRYHVILANGDVHFQYFDGFAVDSADLQFAIVVEGAHLIFD